MKQRTNISFSPYSKYTIRRFSSQVAYGYRERINDLIKSKIPYLNIEFAGARDTTDDKDRVSGLEWYADVNAKSFQPLHKMSEERKKDFYGRMARFLAFVNTQPDQDEDDWGKLLHACISGVDDHDYFISDDKIIITGWGLIRRGGNESKKETFRSKIYEKTVNILNEVDKDRVRKDEVGLPALTDDDPLLAIYTLNEQVFDEPKIQEMIAHIQMRFRAEMSDDKFVLAPPHFIKGHLGGFDSVAWKLDANLQKAVPLNEAEGEDKKVIVEAVDLIKDRIKTLLDDEDESKRANGEWMLEIFKGVSGASIFRADENIIIIDWGLELLGVNRRNLPGKMLLDSALFPFANIGVEGPIRSTEANLENESEEIEHIRKEKNIEVNERIESPQNKQIKFLEKDEVEEQDIVEKGEGEGEGERTKITAAEDAVKAEEEKEPISKGVNENNIRRRTKKQSEETSIGEKKTEEINTNEKGRQTDENNTESIDSGSSVETEKRIGEEVVEKSEKESSEKGEHRKEESEELTKIEGTSKVDRKQNAGNSFKEPIGNAAESIPVSEDKKASTPEIKKEKNNTQGAMGLLVFLVFVSCLAYTECRLNRLEELIMSQVAKPSKPLPSNRNGSVTDSRFIEDTMKFPLKVNTNKWKSSVNAALLESDSQVDVVFDFEKNEITFFPQDGPPCSGYFSWRKNGDEIIVQQEETVKCTDGSWFSAYTFRCRRDKSDDLICFKDNDKYKLIKYEK